MQNDSTILQQPNPELPRVNQLMRFANKKTVVGIVILGLIIAALFYFKDLFVAATVNGSPISRLYIVQQLEKQGGKNMLDSLITEKLIQNEAKKKGVSVSDDEINQEVKSIEASVTKQGGTLEDALLQQNLTLESLKERIRTQKMVEKLLEGKVQVTDEEVNKYITDNDVALTKENEAETKTQITDQIREQKLGQEAQVWISSLKAQAKIKYYVNY